MIFYVLSAFSAIFAVISLAKGDMNFLILSGVTWVGSLIVLTIQVESLKIQKAIKRD